MLKDIRQITYRGSLKSCNYSCIYCPFSKNIMTKLELEEDKTNLYKFVEKLENTEFEKPVEILFTPYGEALIHEYYRDVFCDLTSENFVDKIGCQTNLSFDVDSWLSLDMDFSKVFLLATFHPSMADIDSFVLKVKKISKVHNICVGVVGNPKDIDTIKNLRSKLPINVYLWVNAMDGLGRKYTDEEIEFFTDIDYNFGLEVGSLKEYNCNCGSEHIFLDSSGKIFGCNRHKQVLGNIYNDDNFKSLKCSGRLCDCYLAYSHNNDFIKNGYLSFNNLFRVHKKLDVGAIFFDIDGTLTESEETLLNVFQYISKKVPIYLATELPEKNAIKKVSYLKEYISGGVFAGGSYVVDYKNGFKYIESFDINKVGFDGVLNHNRTRVYREEDKVYRIITLVGLTKELPDLVDVVNQGNGMVSLVSKGCNKATGIQKLSTNNGLDLKSVMSVGNDLNDIVMFKICGYSVAVLDSCDEVRNNATFNLNVSQIPFLI